LQVVISHSTACWSYPVFSEANTYPGLEEIEMASVSRREAVKLAAASIALAGVGRLSAAEGRQAPDKGPKKHKSHECRYRGNIYIKNTSGTNVRMSIDQAGDAPTEHYFPPGHDSTMSPCVSTSTVPPSEKKLHARLLDSAGNIMREVDIAFHRSTAYSEAGVIFDGGDNTPSFSQAEITEEAIKKEDEDFRAKLRKDADDYLRSK
jgi:hypothetical protein